jgi:NAD(P)-dependent dehydrogenase (short-subunit alcohol dehydrogenase family)
MISIDLTGKVILVTGGSRGIGAAISRTLIDAGARVAIQYHSSDQEARKIAATGEGSQVFRADLNDFQETAGLFRRVLDHFGQLDVLINNAGIAFHSSPDKEDAEWLSEWENTLRVNLISAAYLCKLTIPVFEKNGGGVIINVSSRAAHRGDTRDYLAYAASKGGMESLTKSLARAYGKQGIMVYGVAPGFTRTDMAQSFIDTYGEEYALNDIALTELTTPEDIAPLMAFLASGMAKHATGTTIDVNAASYVR